MQTDLMLAYLKFFKDMTPGAKSPDLVMVEDEGGCAATGSCRTLVSPHG